MEKQSICVILEKTPEKGAASGMEWLFAPMEGVTYAVYRKLHREFFPGAARYYTPFIAPDSKGGFRAKYLRELTADREAGLPVIPQLLVNNADAFNATADVLHELGFDEINLNIGCPSGTVFAKRKGSGMLSDLSSLDACLDGIYNHAQQKNYCVSVKTRMGVHSTEEFPEILEIYTRYPLSGLIVHARARDGMYKSEPDLAGFAALSSLAAAPVTYNGNLFSADELNIVLAAAPKTASFMAARGIIANPALFRILAGGNALELSELQGFHDALLEAYLEGGLSPQFTAERMKQLWYYMIWMFDNCKKEQKALLKSRTLPEYRSAASALFQSGKFNPDGKFVQI